MAQRIQNLKVQETFELSVSTVSSGYTIQTSPMYDNTVRIANSGTRIAFVRLGQTGQDASTTPGTGYTAAILPGAIETFSVANKEFVSAVTESGSTTLYCNIGTGS